MLLHGRKSAASRQAPARPAFLRRACAVAAAAVLPVLAGCEAGQNAPVLQWHPTTNGASATIPTAGGSGEIAVRNVFVLSGPPAATLPAGSSAGVFLALVNTGRRDTLVRITAPGTASTVTLPGGRVALPRSQSVLKLAGPEPKVILHNLTHSLAGGATVRMVFTFQNAGSKTLYVPVLAKSQYYATYSPVPTPSATSTATKQKKKHRGHAAATASPTPTATP